LMHRAVYKPRGASKGATQPWNLEAPRPQLDGE
jgi:hypothetical protein